MRAWASVAVFAVLFLAGCTSGGNGPKVTPIDPDTGVIRGLVVDQAIAPIGGALVTISGGRNVTTDAAGAFNFTDVVPGDYIVAVGRAGFRPSQTTVHVTAGEAEPDLVKLLLERITTAQPYVDHFKLEGFYQCAFSYGNPGDPFITDSCDFVYRTGWDAANETGNPPPAPRTAMTSVNTQFIDIPDDTFAVVQEAFWDDEKVPVMMVLLSSTPIDNACDCSDTDYLDVTAPNPTFGRLDRYNATGEAKGFPVGQKVAARGFLSWESTATAQNLQFVVITSLFHNYVPDPAWTFETRDSFPVG